jgi:hypothetical protein
MHGMINIFKKICPLFSLIEGYARLVSCQLLKLGQECGKLLALNRLFPPKQELMAMDLDQIN